MKNCIVVIPALKPDEKLIALIHDLKREGLKTILVVDDGSGAPYQSIFAEAGALGCIVAVHEENRGKGAALKTAFSTAVSLFGEGNSYITADADGQHRPADIRRIAQELLQHPDSLILGTRDFGTENVPLKSRLGNRFTAAFFRVTNGVKCPDTQTGLRGIPACLEALALAEDGDRYEYEMNFLSDAAGRVPFVFVPIETVYIDDNRSSHFRPVADSLRIYGRFLRFACSSLAGFAVDFSVFLLLLYALSFTGAQAVFAAGVAARLCSGTVNFLLNRSFSFRSKQPAGGEAVRYAVLFFCQMFVSAGCTALAAGAGFFAAAAKLVVDSCLFLLSYMIQKNWVFRRGDKRCRRTNPKDPQKRTAGRFSMGCF